VSRWPRGATDAHGGRYSSHSSPPQSSRAQSCPSSTPSVCRDRAGDDLLTVAPGHPGTPPTRGRGLGDDRPTGAPLPREVADRHDRRCTGPGRRRSRLWRLPLAQRRPCRLDPRPAPADAHRCLHQRTDLTAAADTDSRRGPIGGGHTAAAARTIRQWHDFENWHATESVPTTHPVGVS